MVYIRTIVLVTIVVLVRLGSAQFPNFNQFDQEYNRQQQDQRRPSGYNINRNELDVRDKIAEIRRDIMYPRGNLLTNIHAGNQKLHLQLNYPLPYFGFLFNYTWVSMNGHIAFSDSPPRMDPPLKFPIDDWPLKADPAFIGVFYATSKIGEKAEARHIDAGVYLNLVKNIGAQTQSDENYALYHALKKDILEGMIGTAHFDVKHALIVTWQNITFGGGSKNAVKITNTYQLVVVTDERRTYAIFNYQQIDWTSSTDANGDQSTGTGGTPAYVGFNAGNGTRAFEYRPYSQQSKITDLLVMGQVNNHQGRHIFRIDEQILPGVCNYEYVQNPTLVVTPESGNLLGGTEVNVTGPCFQENSRIRAKFKDQEVSCTFVNRSIATCIMPRIMYGGYVDLAVTVGNEPFLFKNKFYIEPPAEAQENVWFTVPKHATELRPPELHLRWNADNLTSIKGKTVKISLWGYREPNLQPEVVYIDMLEDSVENKGEIIIHPDKYAGRDNWQTRDIGFGFIMINLTDDQSSEYKRKNTPSIWSRPFPLGWYFVSQWEREGNWIKDRCKNWDDREKRLHRFAYEVPRCPCTLTHAYADRGRFAPDPTCDQDGNAVCIYNSGAQHCVRSGYASMEGAGQQCCYDQEGFLLLSMDSIYGGKPSRSHPFGSFPYTQSGKLPSLSYWLNDVMPFHYCCVWGGQNSDSCHAIMYRRRSQDCVGYQSPNVSLVWGDPHILTYDNTEYTFNGLGEYVLTRVDHKAHKLDVQGRFQQVIDEQMSKRLPASELTAVAMQDNVSSVVEVQLRHIEARWRYRLNVLVDHKFVYFDRPHLKMQTFRGVTVYTPGNILNQSHVVVLFQSGAGVEVIEAGGHMSCRVYLPKTFMNLTRGLLGNWTGNREHDFTLPSGNSDSSYGSQITNFENIHRLFGLKWVLKNSPEPDRPVGRSLFFHEFERSSNLYFDINFRPNFEREQKLLPNSTISEEEVTRLCSLSYQCRYDFVVTQNRDFAKYSRLAEDTFKNLKNFDMQEIIACGALHTPTHGRKSTNKYVAGTTVKFECEAGYMVYGETWRECLSSGEWSWPNLGRTRCVREDVHRARRGALVFGIILSVGIPCILLGLIAFIYVHKRAKKRKADFMRGESRAVQINEQNAQDEETQKLKTDA